jgi:hypothetical protein
MHLFKCCQNDESIDFIDLCEGVGSRPYSVLKALGSLGRAGLVDPRRLRLTLDGLAVAAAIARPAARAAASPREPQHAPGVARCAA